MEHPSGTSVWICEKALLRTACSDIFDADKTMFLIPIDREICVLAFSHVDRKQAGAEKRLRLCDISGI
jgi:hypothetical protein